MKVCMVVYSFYEADTRVMQYANALARRGDAVDVLALGKSGQQKHERIEGVNVYRVQTRAFTERTQLSYAWKLIKFWAVSTAVLTWKHLFKRYELVHVHNLPDCLVFSAIVPRLLGTPVILDIHDLLPEMYADKFSVSRDSFVFKILLWAEKLSIAFSSHTIISNDIWYGRLLSRSALPGRLTAIRNYPDPRIFHSYPQETPNHKFLIIYPGSLNWYQGVDVMIKAFGRVADQMPDAELHIYGEGAAKPALVKLTDALGLDGRVQFRTLVPAAEIARIMASATLAIEPKQARSRFANEAASMKILEFMAVNVPLIVSRTIIHSYYFDDSMVKFFTAEDDGELAACIQLLYRDEDLRNKLVANARKYVHTHNWDAKKYLYLELVDRMVGMSRPGIAGVRAESNDGLRSCAVSEASRTSKVD